MLSLVELQKLRESSRAAWGVLLSIDPEWLLKNCANVVAAIDLDKKFRIDKIACCSCRCVAICIQASFLTTKCKDHIGKDRAL